MAGVPISQQRCSPPFGVEPLQKLHPYASCFPELWDKMVDRVPGVGSAVRYALTELHGFIFSGLITLDKSDQFIDAGSSVGQREFESSTDLVEGVAGCSCTRSVQEDRYTRFGQSDYPVQAMKGRKLVLGQVWLDEFACPVRKDQKMPTVSADRAGTQISNSIGHERIIPP